MGTYCPCRRLFFSSEKQTMKILITCARSLNLVANQEKQTMIFLIFGQIILNPHELSLFSQLSSKLSLVANHDLLNYVLNSLTPCYSSIPQSIWGVNLKKILLTCIIRDSQPTLKDHFASIKCKEKNSKLLESNLNENDKGFRTCI